MKRIILLMFVLTGFGVVSVSKTSDRSVLYGGVRAELVRELCKVSDISDEKLLATIENESLDKFVDTLEILVKDKKRKDHKGLKNLDEVVKHFQLLSGMNNDYYCEKLAKFIDSSVLSLRERYLDNPDKVVQLNNIQFKLHNFLFYVSFEYKMEQEKAKPADVEELLSRAYKKACPVTDKTTDGESDNGLWLVVILSVIAGGVSTVLCLRLISRKNMKQSMSPEQNVEMPAEPVRKADVEAEGEVEAAVVPDCPVSIDMSKVRRSFAYENKEVSVVGASVLGLSHDQMKMPCQDYCGYESLDFGWGIAVTADGAGSAAHSDVGSHIAVERAIFHFKSRIQSKDWLQQGVLPTDAEWMQLSYNALKAVRDDMETFAQKKSKPLSSLATTLIVLVHTPVGILAAHVGDGRAGYCNKDGEWKSIMVPHKGEEANQTIFMTSDFWGIPNYVMSGVFVPESRVIREVPSAFALMSDGSENTCWLCNRYNSEKQIYEDLNMPYDKFFVPVTMNLDSMRENREDLDSRKDRWAEFLMVKGPFAKEPDDKTMVIGKLYY